MTLKNKLWDKFCNYSLELDGEQPSDYYGGATVMLEWMIVEYKLDKEPSDELVEKALNELEDCVGIGYSHTQDREWGELHREKAEMVIRKLLQSHRPIQVDEIMKMLGQYINLKGQDKGKIAFEAQIRKLLEEK